MTHDIDATLAALIDPIPVDVFFRDFYGKRVLHVPGAAGKFRSWFDEETWRTVPLTEPTVVYASDFDGVPLSRVIQIQPAQVVPFYEAGLMTVGRVDHQPRIGALMDGLRASLQFPSGKVTNLDKVICFASKLDAGYKLHWDLHHNFILQISGTKRWHCGEGPAVDAPLDGATVAGPGEPAAEYDGEIVTTPRLEDLTELILKPGDFLYMPPGTWHAPRSIGPSNHLSVALGHRPIYKLISDVLKVEIGRQRWWRQGFPALRGEDRRTGAVPRVVAEIFEEAIVRLRADLARLDVRQFHKEWSLEVAEHHRPPPPQPSAPVERSDRLARPTPVPIRFCLGASEEDADETEVYVFAGDESFLRLPEGALRFVARLAAADDFTAEEALGWDEDYTWPDVSQALTALVDHGILVHLEPRGT